MGIWATAALGRQAAGRELSVRIVGCAESRRLNKRWRNIDKPTNVLSFPTQDPNASARAALRRATKLPGAPLGDLVMCAPLVRDEALEQGKSITAHWAHLVVHGTLHLIGYDHELGKRERYRMERREIRVLRELGFGNPYASAAP